MAAQFSLDELETELKRRGGVITGESVLAPREEGGWQEEVGKGIASLGKGSLAGILDIVGGWGNLYDYLNKETGKDPSKLSSQGMKEALNKLTGIDLQKIDGYKAAYTVGRTGAPAAALSAVGLPGLFGRTAKGLAGEAGIAGGTGLAAETVAPDSPLAQFAMQTTPYAIKGGLGMARSSMLKPAGELRPTTPDLLSVGPLTPGEATGSRMQLAKEARTEAAPAIEAKGTSFRQEQALSTESFLNNLFNKASSTAIANPQETANKLTTAFQNYGKSLSSKLTSDAKRDFGAVKASGGMIDTQPVIVSVENALASIPKETPGFSGLQENLNKILKEFSIPEVPATSTPSLIVNEAGLPAMVTETAAVPAQSLKIPAERLQKNLSAWGQAAWSGEYTLNNSNIFSGIAPGQAKGIARAVLRGYKNALDDAIDAGIPGADQLKKARDTFSANLDKIDEFAERPIVKAFGKPVHQLVPEEVLPQLADMPDTQRKLLFQIMGKEAPEMADTIRRLQFNKVLSEAQAPGRAAESPTFIIDKALTELDKKSGDFSFLFVNPDDKANAMKALQYMRSVIKQTSGDVGGIKGADIYSSARGLGAQSGLANALKELGLVFKDLLASPNAMADVVFNAETVKTMMAAKNKPTLQKVLDTMSSVGKATAVRAVRAGPRMGEAQVAEPQPEQAVEGGPNLEQLMEELQKREPQ